MNVLASPRSWESPVALLIGAFGLAVVGLALYLRWRPLRPRVACRPAVAPRSAGRVEQQRASEFCVRIEIHNRGRQQLDCKALGYGSRPHPLGERELREAIAASARSVQPEQPWPGSLAAGSALTLEVDLHEMQLLVDDLNHGFLGRVWVATQTDERFYARLSDTKRFIKELGNALKADDRAGQPDRLA